MNVLGWVIVVNLCMCFCGAGSEILASSVSHIFSASRILTHLKRPWCWGRLKVGGKGDDRGWDGWMASLTEWKWVWVNSGSWRWIGRPSMLQSMGSQRIGHDWTTELNWTENTDKEGSKVIVPIYSPSFGVWELLLFHILTNTWYFLF